MGRKPNQLILEFFERGPKLEDASNRYQHTCKACGEKFPKGRIDSLTTHLVKKCPAIALRDRQRALLQLHELPDIDNADAPRGTRKSRDAEELVKEAIARGEKVDLPITTRNWTALETLAEVSRQIDLSEKRTPTPHNGDDESGVGTTAQSEEIPTDPALLAEAPVEHRTQGQLVEAWSMSSCADVGMREAALKGSSSGPALPPIQALASTSNTPSASPLLPSLYVSMEAAENAPSPASLSHTATLPPEGHLGLSRPGMLLEPDLSSDPENAGITDKFFPRAASTWPLAQHGPAPDAVFFDNAHDQAAAMEAMKNRAATFPRPIAMNPHTAPRELSAYFSTSKQPKAKVRGRFSASRRKEVQEVRKRGACIRCRMLKKPCSGDHPCSTCRSVESARLWKQPCVRTRIADELELYSAGLHTVLAYHAVSQARNQAQFEDLPGRIEATHFSDPSICVSFAAFQERASSSLHDPTNANDQLNGGTNNLRLLDSDAEDYPGKLEAYVKAMAPVFFDRELSYFMKPTLAFASELAQDRSDALLARVLELWSLTHILADVEMHWETFQTTPADDDVGARIPIDQQMDETSYRLICSQLSAATEKCAAKVSKHIMNELERRLLQRAQSGWLETFLVAVCLLNCVERMSWLFQTWDNDHYRTKVLYSLLSHLQQKIRPANTLHPLLQWPLDRQPPFYYEQAEKFADIVQMLLKMRSLPPKTHMRVNGLLATDSDETAQRYFDALQLSRHDVEARQSAVFDPSDSRSLELKFCAKLLLPAS
ncbi:MAG: hypothetical protein M1833_004751 [Piccolia ochrophora]|nr:MAG: hypothetical protein M1833_004751 [Piccolia ochrophora]